MYFIDDFLRVHPGRESIGTETNCNRSKAAKKPKRLLFPGGLNSCNNCL